MSGTAVVRLRDGAELWTAVSGTGPPVVCLHGGPGLWDYLAPLAALLDEEYTVVRFDQRGCGRSTGHGAPFTIGQAVDDLDQVRAALGFSRWAVAGHSWGAELALRYAARHTGRTTAVAYIAGVGAGNGFKDAHAAELGRRLGRDRERWAALSAIPAGDRTPAEERERCLLQWRTDFSPAPDAASRALALWETRPPGASVNAAANRELWNDRETEDLRHAAARVTCPVTMIFGSDDPRPWTASDSLLAALPNASRTVLKDAGHAPWAERPADTRRLVIGALRPALPTGYGISRPGRLQPGRNTHGPQELLQAQRVLGRLPVKCDSALRGSQLDAPAAHRVIHGVLDSVFGVRGGVRFRPEIAC